MALRVGALRFDIVADTSALKKGLEQARAEMEKTRKTAAKSAGGRAGSKTFGISGASITQARMLAVGVAGSAAAVGYAVAKLDNSLQRHADALAKWSKEARRSLGNVSVQRIQAREASGRDLLSRGERFHMLRLQREGLEVTQEQVNVMGAYYEATERSTEATSAFGREIAVAVGPAMIDLKNATTDLVKSFAGAVRWFNEYTGGNGIKDARDIAMSLLGNVNAIRRLFGDARARGEGAGFVNTNAIRASDIRGGIAAPTSAAQGSDAEYQFFLRRQERRNNLEVDLVKDSNVTLHEINAELRRVTSELISGLRDPITGDPVGGLNGVD